MKNKIISKQSIKREYNFLKRSEYLGIKGVLRIDSEKPGPVFGLTICTHGNEIAGLAAVYYLRNMFNLESKLLKGSVIIVLNNIRAAEKAIKAKTDKERLNSRFVDLNFNRLPKNLSSIENDPRYEIKRAKELLPIWKQFEIALDIHSTIQENPPMIIAYKNIDYNLIRNFPVKVIISNIVPIQIGAPATYFYGQNKNIQKIGIESGSHNNISSQKIAIESALSLLKTQGMLKSKLNESAKVFEEYYIYDSVLFSDKKCRLAKVFKDFEAVSEGQNLAKVNSKIIKAKKESCIFMAPKGIRPIKIGEEAIFLSKPVNKKII